MLSGKAASSLAEHASLASQAPLERTMHTATLASLQVAILQYILKPTIPCFRNLVYCKETKRPLSSKLRTVGEGGDRLPEGSQAGDPGRETGDVLTESHSDFDGCGCRIFT